MRDLLVLACLVSFTGCVAADLKDPGGEEDAPVDGAYDSFRSPTDHGVLAFGTAARSELTAAAGYHAWTFSLTGPASVTVRTEAATLGGREVDTVLYLYREGASGWGRNIASNDDAGGSLFSSIRRELTAGRYRAVVKGYRRTTRGPFGIVAECSGAGCGAMELDCLFGDRFDDVFGSRRLLVGYTATHTDPGEITGVLSSQLIRAMNAAGHPEVTSVEAALALTPERTAERFEIYDSPGARGFTAWRFVLGDHYFGSIYAAGSTIEVSRIVDGDLAACTVGTDVCMLGERYRAFADAEGLEPVSDATLTSPSGLSPARAAQLLRAVQQAYAEATTPAAAFTFVDRGAINETVRRDAATGRTFVAYEYGAGDNSYGAFFEGDAVEPVGTIQDGDVYACTALRPAPPPAMVGEDCTRAIECADGLLCTGIAEEPIVGRCVSTAAVPGQDAACSASAPCSAGLVCSGLTRGAEGICRPEWMRRTFTSSTACAIPDNNATGLGVGTLVYGLATVDTDVEVTVRIAHARSTDLRITLVNAAGTEQLVYDGMVEGTALTSPFELTRSVSGSGDESVTGQWFLRVVDRRRGTTGVLERWSLTVTTRWD
jgi:subtilisin-like proprotein convertase family protein